MMTQVDIRLDLPALREKRIRQREPVTLSLSDRKLKTVLQAMLIDLHLTWILRDGVLWITTRLQADEFLKTAVYDVRDLCRDAAEADALGEAIVSQTEPVWEESRGPATIQFAQPGTLVVCATENTLDEVIRRVESGDTRQPALGGLGGGGGGFGGGFFSLPGAALIDGNVRNF